MTTLVLFDIDGTLVLTGGAGLRAMALAFEELFDVPDAFRGMQMAGRTDAWILSDAAEAHGIARDSPALARFPNVYLPHLTHLPHPAYPPFYTVAGSQFSSDRFRCDMNSSATAPSMMRWS